MVKGAELDKQIYKEGEPTWGLKNGFLDVESVIIFLGKVNRFEEEKNDEIRKLDEASYPDAYMEGLKDGITMMKQEIIALAGKGLT